MNYYEILEVSQKASPEVIKAAYKSLMQRHHPDKNPDNADAVKYSTLVVQAYDVLSDSNKRAAYDIELGVKLANRLSGRAKELDLTTSQDNSESGAHWLSWLFAASLLLTIWVVWPSFERKAELPVAAPKVAGPMLFGNPPEPPQYNASELTTPSASAIIVPVSMKNLTVELEASSESSASSPAGARHILTIQTINVVVGKDYQDRFVSFMEKNKSHISSKLAEKLAHAKYEMLIRHDGDHYLKKFVLDSIGEITGTNRSNSISSSDTGSSANYGAIDVLLPDSYTVK